MAPGSLLVQEYLTGFDFLETTTETIYTRCLLE